MMFTVTDLKQYFFCPRVLYYHHCLPDIRPITDKMEAGLASHETENNRESRRSLTPYGLESAERHFDVRLPGDKLPLHGLVDMVLAAPNGDDRRAFPVDFKLANKAQENWKIQLAIYALLLEEQWGVLSDVGYIYLIPQRRAERVALTPSLKQRAEAALAQMLTIVLEERMPNPPKNRGKCVDCEFRRFCNDV
jgi:CRISPR-associated exonuclease Cas4